MKARGSNVIMLAFLSSVSSTALASPLFELVGATQGGGGQNPRAVASDTASTYFNPAFLVDAKADFELGVFVLSEQIGVSLRGRPDPNADLTEDVVNMTQPDGSRYERSGIPTEWLRNGKSSISSDRPMRARPRQAEGSGQNLRVYQVVGLVRKAFDDRLALGVYAVVPYSEFTGAAAFYSDEREQNFSNSLHPEMYGDRMTATSLAFGVGVRVHPVLSLGVTFTLALKTSAATPTYLNDLGNVQGILVDTDVKVNAAVAPHFGAALKLSKQTQLSATVHTPQKTEISTEFSFLLPNGFEQSASVGFTHAYLPWIFAIGAQHEIIKQEQQSLSLVGTASYALWSNYIDRHSERPVPAYGWYDTLSGAVGARYAHGPSSAALDINYQPTPVPDQTGRTNYVDSDRVGAAASYAYAFPLLGTSLRVSVHGQVHHLLTRETTKRATSTPLGAPNNSGSLVDEVPDDAVLGSDPVSGREGLQTNNPGWPGFTSKGYIVAGGVSTSITF